MADTVTTDDLPPEFVQGVKAAVGSRGWTTDRDMIDPYLNDWRRRVKGRTPLMLMPGTTGEVSAIVRLCAEYGISITPQGGNTGLVDGGIPHGEVLISLRGMGSIRKIDPLNNSMTVEAGAILQSVRDAASEHNRLFPLSLGSQGICTIGGLISTNAGGVAVLRYGMMRDLVLGLEVVLPSGEVWNGLTGLRKDNTGYDLAQLFCGAEGTLGIVTAAELKLFPKPQTATGWLIVESPQHAVDLLSLMRDVVGDTVTSFELIPANAVSMVASDIADTRDPLPGLTPWRILVEVSFSDESAASLALEQALTAAMEAELVTDGVIAQSVSQANEFWKIRESIPLSKRAYGTSINHDISARTSTVPELLDQLETEVQKVAPGAEIVAFGHLGDGNIHYGVAEAADTSNPILRDRADRISAIIHKTTIEFGGSVSAEHGIGRLKVNDLLLQKSDVELDLMRKIKRSLDPQNIMNPGRILKV